MFTCQRADVSYFLCCTRTTKEIGDVCTQASEHQQVEIKESSNQMPGVNESGVRESALDPKEAISTESINVLTSAGQ